MSGGGPERRRHRIRSRLQALSCQHRAPRQGSNRKLCEPDLSRSQTDTQLAELPRRLPPQIFLTIIYFEREGQKETEHKRRGRVEREGDTESKAGSELSGQSLTWGLNSLALRS